MNSYKKLFLSIKINFSEKSVFSFNQKVNYIAANKPIVAINFKKDKLKFLKKDLKNWIINVSRFIKYKEKL